MELGQIWHLSSGRATHLFYFLTLSTEMCYNYHIQEKPPSMSAYEHNNLPKLLAVPSGFPREKSYVQAVLHSDMPLFLSIEEHPSPIYGTPSPNPSANM